jgi:hypothetical protein
MDVGTTSPHVPDRGEYHKTAYETAVQLMLYEGNVLWARLNTMIVLNALLIASSTLLIQGNILPGKAYVPTLLAALLSIILYAVMYRGEDFHQYWEAAAAQLEEQFPEETRVVSRNWQLREGEDQRFRVNGKPVNVELSFRSFRARRALISVTVLLVLADILLSYFIFAFPPPIPVR